MIIKEIIKITTSKIIRVYRTNLMSVNKCLLSLQENVPLIIYFKKQKIVSHYSD